jgi:hypothetical protein
MMKKKGLLLLFDVDNDCAVLEVDPYLDSEPDL